MRKYINLKIRKLVLILLLCGFCHTAAFAYGYDRNDQSKSWGYQPVYQSTATTSYVSAAPTYQFRTTSAYISASGGSEPYNPMSGPRRGSAWTTPGIDDDPIGTVPDPAPIGDAPWLFLLLLAAGYTVCRVVWLKVKKI